ncbi:hypothetical protein L1887_58798 [Cichorium endivia]|nr:hypothetical protein L1887_58798 [Cichorium endivia]
MFSKTAAQLLMRFSQQISQQISRQINQRTGTLTNVLARFSTSANTDLNERNKFLKEKYEFKEDSINKIDFEQHFPSLVKELTSLRPELKHIANWYRNVLNYNAVSGKKIRPLTFLNAYLIIMNHYGRTVDKELIYSLAWAIELYQVFFLLSTNDQKEILSQNYGIDDEECIQKVKEIYRELNIVESVQGSTKSSCTTSWVSLIDQICSET